MPVLNPFAQYPKEEESAHSARNTSNRTIFCGGRSVKRNLGSPRDRTLRLPARHVHAIREESHTRPLSVRYAH